MLQEWTGEECVGDAILAAFHRLPNARWMATTLGARGSVLLERVDEAAASAAGGPTPAVLNEIMEGLFAQMGSLGSAAAAAGSEATAQPACVSSSGLAIGEGVVAVLDERNELRLQRGGALGGSGGQEAERRREAAAVLAALGVAVAGPVAAAHRFPNPYRSALNPHRPIASMPSSPCRC